MKNSHQMLTQRLRDHSTTVTWYTHAKVKQNKNHFFLSLSETGRFAMSFLTDAKLQWSYDEIFHSKMWNKITYLWGLLEMSVQWLTESDDVCNEFNLWQDNAQMQCTLAWKIVFLRTFFSRYSFEIQTMINLPSFRFMAPVDITVDL